MTSSTTSISSWLSVRHEGNDTVSTSPDGPTATDLVTYPIGAISDEIIEVSSDVPRMRFTWLTRTSVDRSAGASAPLRASTAPADDQVGTGEAQQFHDPGVRPIDAVRIDTVSEPTRRLRAEPEPIHRPGDARLLERGDLDRDDRGAVGDLAVEAAHDAGDPDRHVVCVADQQVLQVHVRTTPSSVVICSPSDARRIRKP